MLASVLINCSIYVDICFDRLLWIPCVCPSALSLACSSAHPLEVMSTWKCGPVFFQMFFCSTIIQLIIETSVGLNGLCACLTHFKIYLQIKGRPNHRPECWCASQTKKKKKKRKTLVVNKFDVYRLVVELTKRKKKYI